MVVRFADAVLMLFKPLADQWELSGGMHEPTPGGRGPGGRRQVGDVVGPGHRETPDGVGVRADAGVFVTRGVVPSLAGVRRLVH